MTSPRTFDLWSPEEDAVLVRMQAAGMEWDAVAVALGRTVEAVKHRWRRAVPAQERPHVPSGPWSPEEDASLRRLALAGAAWEDIAEATGRSAGGCQSRARTLGLRRPKPASKGKARKPLPPPPPDMLSRRRCHDCGKATTDYRCPQCLAKWRAKNGVSPAAKEDDSYELFGSGWAM